MSACTPDGDCKEGAEVAGIKVPVKVTVDFENGVVAAVDETGYSRTDKFDGVAETADQLVMHGIDGAFGWQLLIHKSSEAASMSFATAELLDRRLWHLHGQVGLISRPESLNQHFSIAASAGAIRAGACAMTWQSRRADIWQAPAGET